MAKVDHLQQLRGRSYYSDSPRSKTKRRSNYDSFHKQLTVDIRQGNVLNHYIHNENKFYNNLLETLQSRLRSTPNFFTELTDQQIMLYSKIAKFQFNVKTLWRKKSADVTLPNELEPFREILFGIHGQKEEGLSDKLLVFYEPCGTQISVWPNIKESIAYELLDHFCKQAKSSKKVFTDEGSFQTYDSLELVNLMQKRHIQLSKKDVTATWDEKNNCTKLMIPYLNVPLIMDNVHLNEAFPAWNILILHQDPNEILLTHAKWEADFRISQNRYLVKYIECTNPNSRMKSRFVQGRR